jgi:hypothetical protein
MQFYSNYEFVSITIINLFEYIFIRGGSMPYGDGTGPVGKGSLTGRGYGSCNCGVHRGHGRGFGRGQRAGCSRPVDLTKEEERKILEAELKNIEAEREAIEKRLKEVG